MTLELLFVLGGVMLGFVIDRIVLNNKKSSVLKKADDFLEKSKKDAQEILSKSKQKAHNIETEARNLLSQKRKELSNAEKRLLDKESVLDKKIEKLDSRKEELELKIDKIELEQKKVSDLIDLKNQELEKVATMSKQDALDMLIKKVEEEFKDDLLNHVKKIEDNAKAEAESKARMILALAMQKYASDCASENTSTTVTLPSDDMKGRIIGRDGRNIQAFERVTGVDVVVDDTPGVVLISAFDLYRRYVAKVSLERLITDGRIHPARIEEVVDKVKGEVDDLIVDLGEKAAFEAGVAGLASEMVQLLGRLKFRTIQSQNLLKHSVDVANLSASIASELGADVSICKRAGLLMFIGVSVDHEVEAQYAKISSEICRKFGLSSRLCNVIELQSGDELGEDLEAVCVSMAAKILLSRPGIGKNNMETFVKRMTELENIATSFDGVSQAYAVHTGSEVRVVVDAEKLDDLQSKKLSHQIAEKIEKDMQYSGQVKVTVLRERRIEAVAE